MEDICYYAYVLVMCVHASNGERPSSAQGSQLIGCHFATTLVDKHAYMLAKFLPNYQKLVKSGQYQFNWAGS